MTGQYADSLVADELEPRRPVVPYPGRRVFRRRGFTLVEAMVLTILAGYCMIPIVGVMSHSAGSVQRFDHTEVLRTLARSRLNENVSMVSYERRPADLETSYHYVYVDSAGARQSCDSYDAPDVFLVNTADSHDVVGLEYSYKIEMSYADRLSLADDPAGPAVPAEYKRSSASLRALVARATFLSVDNPLTEVIEGRDNGDENEDISVSLMALVAAPIGHYQQRVFVADSGQLAIYSLDTRFLNLVKVYYPFSTAVPSGKKVNLLDAKYHALRPTHLAVHPSGNWLAVKMHQKIRLVNVNEESPDNGKGADIFVFVDDEKDNKFLEDPGDTDKIAKDAGIAFRPDGKYLYVTAHSPAKLYRFDVPAQLFDPSWTPTGSLTGRIDVNLANNEVRDMYAGEDGRLYLANGPVLSWYSMFGPFSEMNRNIITEFNKSGEDYDERIFAVGTDRLGKRVLLGYDHTDVAKRRLLWFSTDAYVDDADDFRNYEYLTLPGGRRLRDLLVSPDNRFVGVAANADGLSFLTANPPSAAIWQSANPSSGVNYGFIAINPDLESFVIGQPDAGTAHLLDIPQFAAGQLGPADMPKSTAINFEPLAKRVADVVARVPEYLLVGCSDGKSHFIEYVDIQARCLLPKVIALPGAPVDLALNPSGSRVKVTYGEKKDTFDVFAGEPAAVASLAVDQGTQVARKSAYAIDPDKDAATGKDDFFACIASASGQGFHAPQAPPSGFKNETEPGWIALDLVALNEGGFLVLFRHEKEAGLRKVNWYGKYTYGAGNTVGDYARFATWTSSTHRFPPADAARLAVSPDDRLVAFVTFPASGDNQVSLYDFRAQNFDHETQFPGLISTFQKGPGDPMSEPSIVFDMIAHWRFDETSGTKTADSAGSNHGTLKNMYDSDWVIGQSGFGNCLNFDGSNDHVTVGDLDLNQMTLSAWINPVDTSTRNILGKENSIDFYIGGGDLYFRLRSGGDWITCSEDVHLPVGVWSHAAATWDGSTMRLYFNGKQVDSKAFSGPLTQNDRTTTLGNYDNSYHFKGKLDDIRFWNRALSDEEITAVVNSPPDAGSLVKAFSMNETWEKAKEYPGNMFHYDMWTDLTGVEATKAKSSKRFFGYFHPDELGVKWLGLGIRDGGQMFVNQQLLMTQNFGDGSTDVGVRSAAGVLPHTAVPMQIEHTVNNPDDMGIGPVYATRISDPGAPVVDKSTTGLFDDGSGSGRGSYKGSGMWSRIPEKNFTPFIFSPRLLSTFDLAGSTGDTSALVFSRDVADPILYVLDPDNSKIWMQKMGKAVRAILLPAATQVPNVLAIAPDGQKLFYATSGASNSVHIVDIAMPTTYAFAADINVTAAPHLAGGDGFGSIRARLEMPLPITCLAARPFTRTHQGDRYEKVLDMETNRGNLNIAALNANGIYVMGGADDGNGAPSPKALRFNPVTHAFTDLGDQLKKAVRNQMVVPFDDWLVTLNGNDNTAASDWVQAYNPVTDVIRTSYDPSITQRIDEVVLNQQMTGLDTCLGETTTTVIKFDSGSIRVGSPWNLFDFDFSDTGYFEVWEDSNDYVTYDTGSDYIKLYADRVRVWANYQKDSGGRDLLEKFILRAGNNGSTWPYVSPELDDGGSEYSPAVDKALELNNTKAYRFWQFYPTENMGGSGSDSEATVELQFIKKDIRAILPTDMTSNTAPSRISGSGKVVKIDSWPANSFFHSDTPDYKAFDTDDVKTGWRTSNNSMPRYLHIDLGMRDTVHMITLQRGYDPRPAASAKFGKSPDDSVKKFELRASNDESFSTYKVLIDFAVSAESPKSCGILPFYVAAPGKFRYYRLWITENNGGSTVAISNFQMYSFIDHVSEPTESYLVKTMDDARATVTRERGAACLTPFGIVFGGGLVGTVPTARVSVYWPHLLDDYLDATIQGFGACRNLPAMPGNRVDHCFVWHKGLLYRIGGALSTSWSGRTPIATYDLFDVTANTWTETSVSGDLSTALRRRKAAVCSFGEEIFIFGGFVGETTKATTAAAWNPTTNAVRFLADMDPDERPAGTGGTGGHTATIGMSAVPCGPYIYLIGGSTSDTEGGIDDIIRYTP